MQKHVGYYLDIILELRLTAFGTHGRVIFLRVVESCIWTHLFWSGLKVRSSCCKAVFAIERCLTIGNVTRGNKRVLVLALMISATPHCFFSNVFVSLRFQQSRAHIFGECVKSCLQTN